MSTNPLKFSLSFPGQIWQTALDHSQGIWMLEVRLPAEHKVTYHLVFLPSREVKTLTPVEDADWWTMIIKLMYPVAMLEQYKELTNPQKKDLILYDTKREKVLSRLTDFQYMEVKNGQLVGNDLVSGDSKMVDLRKFGVKNIDTGYKLKFPEIFRPGSESLQLVDTFLQKSNSEVGCEYFEEGDIIIISYYLRLETKFQRKLLLIKEGQEYYHVTQDKSLDGFASGAFFVFENMLVFIKNGNQINGVEL